MAADKKNEAPVAKNGCRVCTMTKSFACKGFGPKPEAKYRCDNCGCSEVNHGSKKS